LAPLTTTQRRVEPWLQKSYHLKHSHKAKPKRAGLYRRVSTGDQHAETQLYDLREFARQRGFEIVNEYTDAAQSSGLDANRFQTNKFVSNSGTCGTPQFPVRNRNALL
jgi:hypothetical protein